MYEFAEKFMSDMNVFIGTIAGVLFALFAVIFIILYIRWVGR